MPLLAVNRKEKGWSIKQPDRPAAADLADFACKRSQYGGIVAGYRDTSRKGGYIAS